MNQLMKTKLKIYNYQSDDVSNGYRTHRRCHEGQMFKIRVPRSRESNFYPVLLRMLKNQEVEV